MRNPRRAVLPALVAALLAVAACNGGDVDDVGEPPALPEETDDEEGEPPPDDGDEVDATAPPEVDVVATGLEAPWDVAFTSEGTAYVTERDAGRVLRVDDDGGTEEVRTFDVEPRGEGGLLGLTADPDGERLYAYYTTPDDNRIVAFTPGADDVEEILTGIPAGAIHNGGRIAFGPDGNLWVGTGDAGQDAIAQEPGNLGGKVLRLTPEGDAPDDNPEPGSLVYTLGHRNVQGLAWDAEGELLVSELGPDVDDEVNRIRAGANYGWPEVTGMADREPFVDPVAVYDPAEASPSGATIPLGTGSGAWEGDFLMTALRGERLWRIELDEDGGVAGEHELLEGEYGRLRQVAQAPDGSLWVLTSNRDGRGQPEDDDDRILRLVPPGADAAGG